MPLLIRARFRKYDLLSVFSLGTMSWETALPLGIIVGATALMGASQGWIHKAFYGKPKAVNQDIWDRAVANRDNGIKAQAKADS